MLIAGGATSASALHGVDGATARSPGDDGERAERAGGSPRASTVLIHGGEVVDPGADADVVVWDLQRPQPLSRAALHMAVDHSPYEEHTVNGWPALVVSSGRVVALDGEFVGEPGAGRHLHRATPMRHDEEAQ